MSGGSYDYFFGRVNEFNTQLRYNANTPLRKAFLKLMINVADAVHDIEWVDSGDYGEGDEDKAIKKCLGADWKAKSIEAMLEEIEQMVEQVNKLK